MPLIPSGEILPAPEAHRYRPRGPGGPGGAELAGAVEEATAHLREKKTGIA
jgi:hypothetical protein